MIGSVALGVFLLTGLAADTSTAPPAWDRQTVALFRTLPVQEAGRVKPLDTYASFKLLKFRGRRSCPGLSGKSLSPMEWLMDCLFRPESAKQYNMFRVDNAEVIVAIGVPAKKKRDYYSYNELLPGRAKLLELGHLYMRKEDKDRSVVESELLNLAMNLREFEEITAFPDFVRHPLPLGDSATLSALFPGKTECRLSELLGKAPQIFSAYLELQHNAAGKEQEQQLLAKFLKGLERMAGDSTALALFPPAAGAESDEWMSPGSMVERAFSGEPLPSNQVELLGSFEELVAAAGEPVAFQQRAAAFHGVVAGLAAARGEYRNVPLEVAFYRLQFFYYALTLYVLSFLLLACSWMRPRSSWLYGSTWVSIFVPTLLLTIGIILRCIIRERPPVTTLYETILFVTAVAVAVALFMEWVNRQGVALAIASILGVVGMFLANKYEAREGADTMVSMVAVLNTNFWLATHVTTITIGYAAGLLSGGLAHIFVIGKLLGLRRQDPEFYRGLSRMVYGGLCFALLFSIVGTVLGGIWANESWGRFWGWDPKENGALLIVLWQLAILHARLGGIVRDFGVNLAAVFGGVVVAFSWFGVNMLGVGLHSYGFANGAYTALISFYAFELLIVLLGGIAWFRERTETA